MLDLLGGRSLTLSELPPSDDEWYLNLLWIDRQKCLLLTHAGTLFSVFRAVFGGRTSARSGTISSRPSRASSAPKTCPPTRSRSSSPTVFSSPRPRAAAP